MLLISGRSNNNLAYNISLMLGIKLLNVKLETFNNGEIKIDIKETVRGEDIVIIQTGYSQIIDVNTIVMETIFLIDALRRSMANTITLVMPLYAYSRQDRKDESRAPISAAVLANLFEHVGLNRLVCMDLHAGQIQGFFRIPVDNLYSIELFGRKLNELYNFNDKKDNFIIIAPDAGAVKRTLKFARVFGLKTCIMHKQRDYSKNGEIKKTIMICDCTSGYSNKIAIICDDMIDSGGTFIKAVEQLKKNGFKSVIGLITHGYFTKDCIDKINKCEFVERMIVSNSIDQTENLERCKKLSIIDVSSQLSEAIKRIHMKGGSLADLFS